MDYSFVYTVLLVHLTGSMITIVSIFIKIVEYWKLFKNYLNTFKTLTKVFISNVILN